MDVYVWVKLRLVRTSVDVEIKARSDWAHFSICGCPMLVGAQRVRLLYTVNGKRGGTWVEVTIYKYERESEEKESPDLLRSCFDRQTTEREKQSGEHNRMPAEERTVACGL
jgi:hypothetical protein